MHMLLGHAARNIYLQAVSLGLGTVVLGGKLGCGMGELVQNYMSQIFMK